MRDTADLRRHAVFCLRLAELCADPPLAARLTSEAAHFHECALRAEFAAESDLKQREMERLERWFGSHTRH